MSGTTAAVAASGLEGILAARQAPAYAQGTKLHWVRWVDFIPESDVELKRQMAEASKALGAAITLETINANDLSPRLTAAIQSGAGADIFLLLYNGAHLYQRALVDVSDIADKLAKAEAGFYDVCPSAAQVGGKWLAVPHSIIGNAVAYRRSWLKEAGAGEYPKTWEEARKVFGVLKKKGKPYGQTLGHTWGDATVSAYPMLWCFGGAETDQTGKKVVLSSKGTLEAVKFMQAFWKECCDEGGPAWDDTNNNRAFLAGEISGTLNGASIYLVAKRQKDKIKDEKGEPMWQDIDHAPAAGGAGRALASIRAAFARDHEVLGEPEARQGLLALAAQEGELREMVRDPGGLLGQRHKSLGDACVVGEGGWAAPDVPPGLPQQPDLRLRRTRRREGHRSVLRSTSLSTCSPRPCRA